MPADESNVTATFAGRARPVVLSDLELAQRWDCDDPTAEPERERSGDDAPPSDGIRLSRLSIMLAMVILAIPAIVVVAFAMALTAR
jgi:hypothetical protein